MKKKKEINSIKVVCNLNLGIVTYKYGHFRKCLEFCQLVLDIEPENTKALYRMALGYKELSEYDEAKKSLIKAAKIKNTKAISELYEEVKRLQDEYNEKSKKLHKGIFNKIEKTEHLYEDAEPEPPRKVKCPQCDEEHEEIQLGRHIIKKKHTEKKRI